MKSEECPLIAEVRIVDGRMQPPRLLSTCELIMQFGGPGHLPGDVSDIVAQLVDVPVGAELKYFSVSKTTRVHQASYFKVIASRVQR